MKKTLLQLAALLTLFAWTTAARADDTALLTIKFPDQKQPKHVILEFYDNDAPQTVESFKKLAHKHFFNDMTFHRVFPHMLVQSGDPFSKEKDRAKVGTGGPGYTLPPEFRRRHTTGAVAMSRLPDNLNPSRRSSGSQFYICLKPMPNLDGQYTVFANVVTGMDVLDSISVAPSDSNDNPLNRIILKSVKILPRAEAEKESVEPAPKVKKGKEEKRSNHSADRQPGTPVSVGGATPTPAPLPIPEPAPQALPDSTPVPAGSPPEPF